MSTISLGLDCSTQSLTAVALDLDTASLVWQKSLSFTNDPRLAGYGIEYESCIVPPRVEGEADQPPKLFLAAMDGIFQDLQAEAPFAIDEIAVINVSGQQHGHVYLNRSARKAFSRLRQGASSSGDGLVELLSGVFAYGTAPIWKTSNTAAQAQALRSGVGGKERMIALSGSDSPLRFSGAVMRRTAERYPEVWEACETVQQISSFLPAVLCGNSRVPCDFGNACGTSLIDYQRRCWSDELLSSAGRDLPGGSRAFRGKLPEICAPDDIVGSIASYFVERYGFSEHCLIAAGSGDNPQTKVLIDGDLLSLGTSFVFMSEASEDQDGTLRLDGKGYANAMYDGLGRPFLFGCRTNGALVWDRLRAVYGLKKGEYAPADKLLPGAPYGQRIYIWQPDAESFPLSSRLEPHIQGEGEASLQVDYAALIDTTLSLIKYYSREFSGESRKPLYISGGPAGSEGVLKRIAAIWNRPVVAIGSLGAGLGAAVAGASALEKVRGKAPYNVQELTDSLLPRKGTVQPDPKHAAAYRGRGGFIQRLIDQYEALIAHS